MPGETNVNIPGSQVKSVNGATGAVTVAPVGTETIAATPGRLIIAGHSYASPPNDPLGANGVYGVANGTKAWPALLANMLHVPKPSSQVMIVNIPASAAAASSTTLCGIIPEEAIIDSVAYYPVSNITGQATNYRTFQLTAYNDAAINGSQTPKVIANYNMVAGTVFYQYYANQILQPASVVIGNSAQLLPRNASNVINPVGLLLKSNAVLSFTSGFAGTGLADPGGILIIRYNTKYRNIAAGGSFVMAGSIFLGGWGDFFSSRPLSQSYNGQPNVGYSGNVGEINVTTTAASGATTILCDPVNLGPYVTYAVGQQIAFGVGNTTVIATVATTAVSNGVTSITTNALPAQIPAGSQGYLYNANGGYESLVSNGLTLLNWGINDCGNAGFDINAITETYRAIAANAACAYMSGATQSNIVYSNGSGGGTWITHTQPPGGQIFNPQSNTNFVTPTGSVKLFSGAIGATQPTITIQLPPSFEGGTVDLFFLALSGSNNGAAATITVDGANPPSGACTINTNNPSPTANSNLTNWTGTITTNTTLTMTTNLSDPANMGMFITGTGIPANTYLSNLGTENGTLVTTNSGTTATLSQSCTNGSGLSLQLLTFIPMVKRLVNLTAGPHSIVVTLTSIGAGNNPAMFFYGYGIEPSNTLTPDLSAPVGILNVPLILGYASYPNGAATNTNAALINTALTQIIAGTATSSQSGNSREPTLSADAFVIDINTAIGQLKQNFGNDGIHPNGRGHAIIANTIFNAIIANSGITPINLGMTSG